MTRSSSRVAQPTLSEGAVFAMLRGLLCVALAHGQMVPDWDEVTSQDQNVSATAKQHGESHLPFKHSFTLLACNSRVLVLGVSCL